MIPRPLPSGRRQTRRSLQKVYFLATRNSRLPGPTGHGPRVGRSGPPRSGVPVGGAAVVSAPVRLRAGAGGAAPHGRGECGRLARGGAGPGRGAARGRGSGRAGASRRGGAAPGRRPGPPVWPCSPPPALGRSPAPAAPPAALPPPRRAMRSCFCLRRGSREPPPAARGTVKCPRPRRRPRPAPLRRAPGGKDRREEGLGLLSARGSARGRAGARGSGAARGPRRGAALGGGRNRGRGAPRAGPGPRDAAVLLGAGRGLLRDSARAGLLLRGAGLRAGRRPRCVGEFAANFVLGWLERIATALRYVVFCASIYGAGLFDRYCFFSPVRRGFCTAGGDRRAVSLCHPSRDGVLSCPRSVCSPPAFPALSVSL